MTPCRLRPFKKISPSVGLSRPTISFISVDLPAPFEPISATFVSPADREVEPVKDAVRRALNAAVGDRDILEAQHLRAAVLCGGAHGRCGAGARREGVASPPPPSRAGAGRTARRFGRSRWAAMVTCGGKILQLCSSSTRCKASSVGSFHCTRAVPEQQHMLAEIGDVLGVVLNDDNRLAVFFVEAAQHRINAVGVLRVELGDRFVRGSAPPAAG